MEVGNGGTVLLLFSYELGFELFDAEEKELWILHDFLIFSAGDVFIEFGGGELFFGGESVGGESIILAIMKGLNEIVDRRLRFHRLCQ